MTGKTPEVDLAAACIHVVVFACTHRQTPHTIKKGVKGASPRAWDIVGTVHLVYIRGAVSVLSSRIS